MRTLHDNSTTQALNTVAHGVVALNQHVALDEHMNTVATTRGAHHHTLQLTVTHAVLLVA